jgi:hypothetical protein
MAVLNFMVSMSSPTFLMVRFTAFSLAGEKLSLPSMRSPARFQTRSRKRLQPLTAVSDQGTAFSKSPMNMMYSLSVSAPYWATTSLGLTTLPRDLDIFSPPSPRIMPWLVRLA